MSTPSMKTLDSSAMMEELRQKKRKQIADNEAAEAKAKRSKAKKAKAKRAKADETRLTVGQLAMINREIEVYNDTNARRQVIEFVHSYLMKQDLTKPIDIFVTVGHRYTKNNDENEYYGGYWMGYTEQIDEGNCRSHDDVTSIDVDYKNRVDPDIRSYNIDEMTYFVPDCLVYLRQHMQSLDPAAKVYLSHVGWSFYGPASNRIYIWCDMTAV
jgi:hypothetical protein